MGAASALQDPSPGVLQFLTREKRTYGGGECHNMDVVDACRGTSLSQTYRANFEIYTGPCDGNFVSGLPIYKSTDRPKNQPLFLYPIDIYPDNWSVTELQGLVRWRIVSFENFDDRTSCRIESANIFHIEFAADGQPFNFFPSIYCYDAKESDFSGFKSSTINIRCNDAAPSSDVESSSESSGGNKGVVIGVIAVLLLIGAAGFFLWTRYGGRRGPGIVADCSRKNSNELFNGTYSIDHDVERGVPIGHQSQQSAKCDHRTDEKPDLRSLVSGASQQSQCAQETMPDSEPDIIDIARKPMPLPRSTSRLQSDVEQPSTVIRKQSSFGTPGPRRIKATANKIDRDLSGVVENSDDFHPQISARPTFCPNSSNKDPDLHLSRRSRFKNIRSQWSERGRAFDRNSTNGENKKSRLRERSRTRGSVENGRSPSEKESQGQSHCLERSKVPNHPNRNRSNSREPSSADDHTSNEESGSKERSGLSGRRKTRSRSTSLERIEASGSALKSRSLSNERPNASGYAIQMRSGVNIQNAKEKSRSKERSTSRRLADLGHNKTRSRSTSTERAKTSSRAAKSRSLSNERSNASGYANEERSRSKERTSANDYPERVRWCSLKNATGANKDSGRSRSHSKEKSYSDKIIDKTKSRFSPSAVDDYSKKSLSNALSAVNSHGAVVRSRSNERSVSSRHVDHNRSRSHSAERSGDSYYATTRPSKNSRSASGDKPRSRRGSGEFEALDLGAGTKRKGRGSVDASKADTSVTKNPDGTVVLAKKRTRDDGAVVTTTTKYASMALARSHGVHV
jgi:hypothetical protein